MVIVYESGEVVILDKNLEMVGMGSIDNISSLRLLKWNPNYSNVLCLVMEESIEVILSEIKSKLLFLLH